MNDCLSTNPASTLTVHEQAILEAFSYSPQHAERIVQVISGCSSSSHITSNDAVAALAWWLARDLYSSESDIKSNVERIAFGLEAASGQLLSYKERLKNIS